MNDFRRGDGVEGSWIHSVAHHPLESRASISDNGGWSVGGGMDVRGGGSGGGGPGSWKSCQAR